MSMLSLTEETIDEMKKKTGDIPGMEAWEEATKSWIALMPEPMRAQAQAMSQPLAAASAMSAYGFATASQMMGLFMSNMNTVMDFAEKHDISSFDDQAQTKPSDAPVARRSAAKKRKKSPTRSPARQAANTDTPKDAASPGAGPAAAVVSAAETVALDIQHAARDAVDVTTHAIADAVAMANDDVKAATAITQEMIEAIMPEDFVRPKLASKPAQPDDLKQISGVGPKLEQVLNDLGIWTFDQIADLTAAEIAWVDDYLQFSGRIIRDNWLAQASKLAGTDGAGGKD